MTVALKKIGLTPIQEQENKMLFQNLPSDKYRIKILKALRDLHKKEVHYINMELLKLETGIVPSEIDPD